MRLPQTPDCHIDEEKATEMVRYAISRGVNYFDTAYCDYNGESEGFLGRASRRVPGKGQYRDECPVWAVEEPG